MTSQMNAAVVTSFAAPPRYQRFAVPAPSGGEHVDEDLAVGRRGHREPLVTRRRGERRNDGGVHLAGHGAVLPTGPI